ncbi:MAG: flavin reductase family protein [Phycisphaerales bacterium]|nr:MAG: flavin reductase family protein [Phycisphaerales bacterium]
MLLDLTRDDRTWQDVYKLCVTFVVPRPIALVSTVSADGVRNLAPFSFYNMVSANPPVVMFCPGTPSKGGKKDTLRNVEATGEFVVATVTHSIADPMNQASASLPPEVDEFEYSGFTPRPALHVRPALVAESPVNVECRLDRIVSFGDLPGAGNVVFGRIIAIHVGDAVLAEDGLCDPLKLDAIARLGRLTYARSTDVFDLPRPR